jgi:hypothetical protein
MNGWMDLLKEEEEREREEFIVKLTSSDGPV